MSTLLFMLLVGGCTVAAFRYWEELTADGDPMWLRKLVFWTLKGIAAPTVLWMFFNLGVFTRLPALSPGLPQMQAASGNWLGAYLLLTVVAAFVILSFWTAVTFVWMTATIGIQTSQRRDFGTFLAFWSLLLLPVGTWLVFQSGLSQLGAAVSLWLLPVVHFTVHDSKPRQARPTYSRAVARLKFGNYSEAEIEIIRELEKCQDDFEGWMMLAELYAKHFRDLPQADQAIRDLCAQPGTTPFQASIALNRLADWHLNLGNDPERACQALVLLCERLQGTHFARMAQQRISQLPVTRKDLIERREKKPLRLPALRFSAGDDSERETKSKLSQQDAMTVLNQQLEKLRADPDNVAARERYATVLAEELGKVEMAIEQVELLLAMPDQPEKKMVEWLGLMVVWHLNYRNDPNAARPLLKQLILEYPQTAQAFAAQRRLKLMEFDERPKQRDPA